MDKLIEAALQTAHLPSLPDLVRDLQRLIDRGEDMAVIADLLGTDTGMVARVIELANSAFYGHKNITRIFDAIHIIGLNRIILFVRTAYCVEILESMDGDEVDMKAFWTRSYVAGLVSANIAERISYPQPDTIYTAGVMMYVGEIIRALIAEDMVENNIPCNQLAAAQMEIWGFPDILNVAIEFYPQPSLCPDRYALPASIIHLTDCIVSERIDEIDPDALNVTHLSNDDIEEISNEFKQITLYQ